MRSCQWVAESWLSAGPATGRENSPHFFPSCSPLGFPLFKLWLSLSILATLDFSEDLPKLFPQLLWDNGKQSAISKASVSFSPKNSCMLTSYHPAVVWWNPRGPTCEERALQPRISRASLQLFDCLLMTMVKEKMVKENGNWSFSRPFLKLRLGAFLPRTIKLSNPTPRKIPIVRIAQGVSGRSIKPACLSSEFRLFLTCFWNCSPNRLFHRAAKEFCSSSS